MEKQRRSATDEIKKVALLKGKMWMSLRTFTSLQIVEFPGHAAGSETFHPLLIEFKILFFDLSTYSLVQVYSMLRMLRPKSKSKPKSSQGLSEERSQRETLMTISYLSFLWTCN